MLVSLVKSGSILCKVRPETTRNRIITIVTFAAGGVETRKIRGRRKPNGFARGFDIGAAAAMGPSKGIMALICALNSVITRCVKEATTVVKGLGGRKEEAVAATTRSRLIRKRKHRIVV